MESTSHSILKIDDRQLISLIETAQHTLVFMAPGLGVDVALAISEQWELLGIDRVKIILDVDPEVARLGYGSIEGLEILQRTASSLGSAVFCQPGIRIGIVIIDNSTIIFSPNPELVEGGSIQKLHLNAISLDHVPGSILDAIGWGKDEQTIGTDNVTSTQVAKVKEDLENNPPLKFDWARIVRGFNGQFEFAELKVKGCSISRKKVSIPTELMAFIRDDSTRSRLRSSYTLIDNNDELSGKQIQQLRKQLIDRWLVLLPGFGYVVLRKNKNELNKAVDELKEYIQDFKEQIKAELDTEIEKSKNALKEALLPPILQNPPPRWMTHLGLDPTQDEIEAMLDSELRRAFGTAEDLIREMDASILFKGVTYEMLNDPKFIEAVKKAIPTVQFTHEEYDAARAIKMFE